MATNSDSEFEVGPQAPEERLLAHLDDVNRVVNTVAFTHRLSASEREELASLVRVKLVDNDYDVIRRFEGRSSFRSYLTVVVQRVLLDWRSQRWGKWRTSAAARRLGPVAVRLEALLYRDGRRLDDAIEVLREMKIVESLDEITAFARQLRPRVGRREVSEDMARDVAVSGAVEDRVLDGEAAEMARRAEEAMAAVLEELAPRAAVVLKMHFLEGCPIAEIARLLDTPQKPLYREVERILAALRRSLQAAGLSQSSVGHLLDDGRLASHFRLSTVFCGQTNDPQPSPPWWGGLNRPGAPMQESSLLS